MFDLNSEIAIIMASLEKKFKIRIVLAVNTGSRVYGLDTSDSDYDIRFVYINQSTYYLGISTDDQTSDVITRSQINQTDVLDNVAPELLAKLDIQGWGLRKVAGKIASSSTTTLDWLNSPIKFIDLPIDPYPSRYDYRQIKFSEYLHSEMINHLDVRTLLDGYSGQAGTYLKTIRDDKTNIIKPLTGMLYLWHCYNWVVTNRDDVYAISRMPVDYLDLMVNNHNVNAVLGPNGMDQLLELLELKKSNSNVALSLKHSPAIHSVYAVMQNWITTATTQSQIIAPTKELKNNYNFSLGIAEIIKRFI